MTGMERVKASRGKARKAGTTRHCVAQDAESTRSSGAQRNDGAGRDGAACIAGIGRTRVAGFGAERESAWGDNDVGRVQRSDAELCGERPAKARERRA